VGGVNLMMLKCQCAYVVHSIVKSKLFEAKLKPAILPRTSAVNLFAAVINLARS
jgi:hypothetical protein